MKYDPQKALDLAANHEWDEAHHYVQSFSDDHACLVHAYLHRVEGDLSNANYWYQRANSSMPDNSLDEELQRLNSLVDY